MKTFCAHSLLLFLFLNATKVKGQLLMKQDSINEFKHALGAGAGFTTGYGLSYRYMPRRFGAQLNFAPYRTDETERYSVGLTFLYRLVQTKSTMLFLYQGNHYYYNSRTAY